MSSKRSKGATGVDNTHRKIWDRSEYHEKAQERDREEKEAEDSKLDARKRKRLERDPLHQGIIVERAKLKARDFEVDLASKLNKSQMQSVTMPLSQQGGYYCEVCDCILKDSLAYLDHINGKYHNRALGMSMDVERATVDEVKKRLELAKKKKAGEVPEDTKYVPDGMEIKAIEAAKDEEDEEESTDDEGQEENDDREEDDFAAVMGFSSFGGS